MYLKRILAVRDTFSGKFERDVKLSTVFEVTPLVFSGEVPLATQLFGVKRRCFHNWAQRVRKLSIKDYETCCLYQLK